MKIFVSYARHDRPLCDAVCQRLESFGADVFRDARGREPGADLRERIKGQIEASELVIAILTKSSVKSSWIVAEVAWARNKGRKVVPFVEEGVEVNDIPSIGPGVERVNFKVERYDAAVRELLDFIGSYRNGGSLESNGAAATVRSVGQSRLRRLGREEVENLLSTGVPDLAPRLSKKLLEVARIFLQDLQARSARFLTFDTLETDSDAIVIRRDSLHALLRAAESGQSRWYQRAGYEAGVLYGVGLVKWFVENDSPGLPKGVDDLVSACVRIDSASNWGEIELREFSRSEQFRGWRGVLSIGSNFLAHELGGSGVAGKESVDKYREFWVGYLEGAFSAALGSWYGIWSDRGVNCELLVAECSEIDGGGDVDLVFEISIVSPRYWRSVELLQGEVLCPYVRREPGAASQARLVLEEFVKELAGAYGSRRMNVAAALKWLANGGPEIARESIELIQCARKPLHVHHHEAKKISPKDLRSAVRSTAAALFLANKVVQLNDDERKILKEKLQGA